MLQDVLQINMSAPRRLFGLKPAIMQVYNPFMDISTPRQLTHTARASTEDDIATCSTAVTLAVVVML